MQLNNIYESFNDHMTYYNKSYFDAIVYLILPFFKAIAEKD